MASVRFGLRPLQLAAVTAGFQERQVLLLVSVIELVVLGFELASCILSRPEWSCCCCCCSCCCCCHCYLSIVNAIGARNRCSSSPRLPASIGFDWQPFNLLLRAPCGEDCKRERGSGGSIDTGGLKNLAVAIPDTHAKNQQTLAAAPAELINGR